jgi:hypothetical protein
MTTTAIPKRGRPDLGLGRRMAFKFSPDIISWIESEALRQCRTQKAVVVGCIKAAMPEKGTHECL